jgi:dienelactone hydrolase
VPVQWIGEDDADRGVRQRGFTLTVDGRCVPGLLWTPAPSGAAGETSAPSGAAGETPAAPAGTAAEATAPTEGPAGRPLVAIGHGGSDHKRQPVVVSLARRLVRHHHLAAVAIDGPVHGDRRADGGVDSRLTLLEFGQRWAGDGVAMTEAMVADWQATISAVQQLPEVGPGPVGWWGVSMGTILGLPLVAADRRIVVSVLGLMGLTGPTVERIAADAPKIRCPVLFLVQREDELFPVESALALFDALGTEDKRLHLYPGRHGALPGEAIDDSEAFVAAHLAAAIHG